jgi:hypothetical protein
MGEKDHKVMHKVILRKSLFDNVFLNKLSDFF